MTNDAARTSSNKRPTTPLRRLSASSLRSASLSASRTRSSTESPLEHLGPIFAELADSIADLAANFQQLDKVNSNLEGFNEAFGGYLYGLRMNAYTVDFDEGPTRRNFDLSIFLAAAEAVPTSGHEQGQQQRAEGSRSPSPEHGNETTFVSNDQDFSFAGASANARGGRGGARGTGTRGRGRGSKIASATSRKKKEEMMAFTDSIIALLPLKYREQQPNRSETEKVIACMRNNEEGLTMAEFLVQADRVPQHRINDSLTALVRAKLVLKVTSKGATTFRLDPTKFPAV